MIRGTKRKMPAQPDKKFDIGATIHNRFDIEVVDAQSGEIKTKAYAENIICNQFWPKILNISKYNNYIFYGNGNGIPSVNDTSLFSRVGYGSSTLHNVDYDYNTNTYSCTKKIVINEQTAVGYTITEVGIGYDASATTLLTHAMLKDMNGNQVSLAKTDTDIFNVYATIYIHFTLPSSSVRMFGNFYVSEYSSSSPAGPRTSGSLLAELAGLVVNPDVYQYVRIGVNNMLTYDAESRKTGVKSYDLDSKTLTIGKCRLAANELNDRGGICSIFINYDIAIDVEPNDGWYGSTIIRSESLGTGDGQTVDFETAFPYASDVSVYVDGTPVQCTVSQHNHKLYRLQSSYPAINYPLLSYFKIIRFPVTNNYGGMYCPPIYIARQNQSYNEQYYCPTGSPKRPQILENTINNTYGVYQIFRAGASVMASNDMVNFVTVCGPTSYYNSYEWATVPEEYRHYKYWVIKSSTTYPTYASYYGGVWFRSTDDTSLKSTTNIHLAEAPPEGSVITVDYTTKSIAKDENHVFDFSVEFHFNESEEN